MPVNVFVTDDEPTAHRDTLSSHGECAGKTPTISCTTSQDHWDIYCLGNAWDENVCMDSLAGSMATHFETSRDDYINPGLFGFDCLSRGANLMLVDHPSVFNRLDIWSGEPR